MQSTASPSTSYAAPAVISLGEEYTDETMVSSTSESHSGYDDGYYYSSSSDSETESSDEEESDSSDYRPTHNRRRSSIAPSLWQAEHARLLSLQNAVLDNERAAWSREKRLESEVARIKFDLARLQRLQQQTQSQQESPSRTLASPEATATSPPPPSSSSSTQIPPPPRCAGPRGPRPKPQQTLLQLHRSPPSHSTVVAATSSGPAQTRTGSAPLLPKFSFESLKGSTASGHNSKPEEHTTAVSVLSHHLTEARSLRAQERQKRRIQHERMRELATLLTLGSEVRKWEERLAWSQIQSNTRAAAADDSQLNKESVAKAEAEADTDADPRGKRLSRSSSLPSNRMSSYLAAPSNNAAAVQSTSSSATRPPLSPALPSLSLSPLWKVSAEMILRRRQLSERPRRTPPAPLAVATSPSSVLSSSSPSSGNGSKPPVLAVPVVPKPAATLPAPPVSPPIMSTSPATTPATTPITATTIMSTSTTTTLARPAHTLRGPREKRSVSSASNSPSANSVSAPPITILSPTLMTVPSPSTSSSPTGSGNGALSASASSLSAKRNSIPPPISIPPNGPFCTTTITVTAPGPGSPKSGTSSSTCNFFISKTTPVKPSALKWAFTAADLAREMQAEEEEEQVRQKEIQQQEACCVSSEGESSGSDDSCQSSSDGSGHSSSSSEGQESTVIIQTPPSSGNVERRGRARFSWRKSIPKDGTPSTETPPLPTPCVVPPT